jgi:hypothetical protein
MHESGEVLDTGFIPCQIPTSGDMKQIAALFTYVKRISLTAALGVSADEDVDAAAIQSGQGNSSKKPPEDPKVPPKKDPPAAGKAKDPHPPIETQVTEGINYLLGITQKRKIPAEFVQQVIVKVTGKKQRAEHLTLTQLNKVIDIVEKS